MKYLLLTKGNILTVIFFLLVSTAYSQPKVKEFSSNFSMKGKIVDKSTGNLLINTNVCIFAFNLQYNIVTNELGEYKINFSEGGKIVNTQRTYSNNEIIFQCYDPDREKIIKMTSLKFESGNHTIIKMKIKL